jgi:hypothetical protein
MNPNYLYKDELKYELGTRGVSSLGDVELLRKIFRSIQAEEVPSNIQNLGKFDVRELFKSVQGKLAELERLTGQDTNSRPLSRVRVSTRVTHVRNRLRHLQGLYPEVTGEFKVSLESLDRVERLLSSVCEDEEGSRVHPEQTGDVGHVVSGGDVHFRSVLGGASRQEVSLITAASAADEVAAQSMDNEQRRQDMAPVPFNSPRFSRVSHPVDFLLKRLSRIDGLDVKQLLTLLADVMRIRSIFQVTDRQLLEFLFPFFEDALGTRVYLAINNGWSFVQFHRDCLDYFLPRRLYELLRQDRYHRLQAKGESFATYINSIKQAAADSRSRVRSSKLQGISLKVSTPSNVLALFSNKGLKFLKILSSLRSWIKIWRLLIGRGR